MLSHHTGVSQAGMPQATPDGVTECYRLPGLGRRVRAETQTRMTRITAAPSRMPARRASRVPAESLRAAPAGAG